MRYDKDLIKYWNTGNNPHKFNIISMRVFKKRQENSEFVEKYGRLE